MVKGSTTSRRNFLAATGAALLFPVAKSLAGVLLIDNKPLLLNGSPILTNSGATLPTFSVANISSSATTASYQTFGHIFPKGAIQPNTQTSVLNTSTQVIQQSQFDALALWPDGSVRLAAVTFLAPSLSSGAKSSYSLKAVSTGSYTPITNSDFLAAITGLTAAFSFTLPVTYSTTVDIKSAFTSSFGGTPDIRYQGPQAMQARVDIPVTVTGLADQSLHLIVDATVYADGNVLVDIQFCNDYAISVSAYVSQSSSPALPPLDPLAYSVTITLNGNATTDTVGWGKYGDEYSTGYNFGGITSLPQFQTQNWRATVSTYSFKPYGTWDSDVQIIQDPSYLVASGNVQPYDLTYASQLSQLSSYATQITAQGFGDPFAKVAASSYAAVTGYIDDGSGAGTTPGTVLTVTAVLSGTITATQNPCMVWDARPSPLYQASYVNANGTGTGGVGTYTLNNSALAGSAASPITLFAVKAVPNSTSGGIAIQGNTGDNPGIGPLVEPSVVWLMSQDYRAMRVALAQADYGATVPWNMRDTNGSFLSTANYPYLVPLPNNGYGIQQQKYVVPVSGGEYSGFPVATFVSTSTSHMPSYHYFPYIMTAKRCYLDNLYGAAAWAIAFNPISGRNVGSTWTSGVGFPVNNSPTSGVSATNNLLLSAFATECRRSAWAFREVLYAATIGHTSDADQQYLLTAVNDNLSWITDQISANDALMGAGSPLQGFWPDNYNDVYAFPPQNPSTAQYVGVALWQQDFLSGTIAMGALFGYSAALTVAQFQRNWIVNRIYASGTNPYDSSCLYHFPLGAYSNPLPPTSTQFNDVASSVTAPVWFSAWSDTESTLLSYNYTNGTPPNVTWAQSGGYYANVFRAVCGALSSVFPNDSGLRNAFDWITSSGAPGVNATSTDGNSWINAGVRWNIVPTNISA